MLAGGEAFANAFVRGINGAFSIIIVTFNACTGRIRPCHLVSFRFYKES